MARADFLAAVRERALDEERRPAVDTLIREARSQSNQACADAGRQSLHRVGIEIEIDAENPWPYTPTELGKAGIRSKNSVVPIGQAGEHELLVTWLGGRPDVEGDALTHARGTRTDAVTGAS